MSTVNTGELLQLEGIKKQFGNVEVLKNLDLCVGRGEFITLLGSSGCGKTTTLRIIAGLETADSGRVLIDGKDVTNLEPDKRGVNMVFQNYALFPHMDVEQNVGYSLKIKGLPKNEIREAVAEVLALVQLSGYEKRKPDELSGGQRQRVAVARAVINKPKVLLLDEPLGALDLQLRRQMQIELKKLQKQLGITFIYITHDQEEALTMSDRIAVMRNGVFEQIGSPAEIYNKPKNAFTARFVGGANILHSKSKSGEEILVAVREEHVNFLPPPNDGLAATITGKSFSGGLLRISAQLDTSPCEEVNSSCLGINSPLEIGDKVMVNWDASNAVLLEKE
jgi:spermidine/putrescine transport system ATP-binding protein